MYSKHSTYLRTQCPFLSAMQLLTTGTWMTSIKPYTKWLSHPGPKLHIKSPTPNPMEITRPLIHSVFIKLHAYYAQGSLLGRHQWTRDLISILTKQENKNNYIDDCLHVVWERKPRWSMKRVLIKLWQIHIIEYDTTTKMIIPVTHKNWLPRRDIATV
jgi:hypothetical protein